MIPYYLTAAFCKHTLNAVRHGSFCHLRTAEMLYLWINMTIIVNRWKEVIECKHLPNLTNVNQSEKLPECNCANICS